MNELFFHKLGRQRYLQWFLDKLRMESSFSIVLGGGIILFSTTVCVFSLVEFSFVWFFGSLVLCVFGLNCLLWGMDQSDRADHLSCGEAKTYNQLHGNDNFNRLYNPSNFNYLNFFFLLLILNAVYSTITGNPSVHLVRHMHGGISGHVAGVIQLVFAIAPIWLMRREQSNLSIFSMNFILHFCSIGSLLGIPCLWIIGVNQAWWG